MIIIIVKNVEACAAESLRHWAPNSRVYEVFGYHIHIIWG